MFNFFSKAAFSICVSRMGDSVAKIVDEIKIIRKPRYNGRIKKRQWEDRRTDRGEGLEPQNATKKIKTETEITEDLMEKIKRRKFALLLSYSGVDYFGMQRNPNTRTIEEDLFTALKENKYISEIGFKQVQSFQFQRAARTDKGVSAARQVVSLKLPENVEIEKINEKLPEVIRVFGIKRVTKGFNSKTNCDSRTYLYLMPTVAFVHYEQMMVQKGFRLGRETFQRINEILQVYVGTKNYHNFTSKKNSADPSAKRHMKTLICEEPFVKDDVEFAVIKIQGQSFMLHQIRKMMGLLIALIKGCADVKLIETAFTTEKVNIPRAPGLGLVLDYVHYDRYNYRYGEDGMHDKLVWNEVDEEVERFKQKYIFPTIVDTELKEESMINWIIRKLPKHKYDDTDNDDDDEDDKIVESQTKKQDSSKPETNHLMESETNEEIEKGITTTQISI